MVIGTVKWFNTEKGFGFISREDAGKDVFVHHSKIEGMEAGQRNLQEGQQVEFNIESTPKGDAATDVQVIG